MSCTENSEKELNTRQDIWSKDHHKCAFLAFDDIHLDLEIIYLYFTEKLFGVRHGCYCLCCMKTSTPPKQIWALLQTAWEAEICLLGGILSLSHHTDFKGPPCRIRVRKDGSFWLQVWGMGKKKFTVKADKYTYSEFPVSAEYQKNHHHHSPPAPKKKKPKKNPNQSLQNIFQFPQADLQT